MKPIAKSLQKESLYLPLLIILSFTTHFPFVLKGFGELDSTRVAVSVIDMISNGASGAFVNLYYTDVIPLYILYLKAFMNFLDYNYTYLPVVMNYTNAVFGTLTIFPAFLLIRRFFENATVAFCTVLVLIFTPSFYQSTIAGFPHLIALFFLLTSFSFYLSALDHRQKKLYLRMIFACISLTICLLFKADFVLAAGLYPGLLLIKSVKDKKIIMSAFLLVVLSGVFFLFFRNLILGPTSGTTMSAAGISVWFNTLLGPITSPGYFKYQAEPIVYGAGILTFSLSIIAFIYYLLKKRMDILIFILSWAAPSTFLWLIIVGNNARHNMLNVLPLTAIVIMFFYEKKARFIIMFTFVLILGNYFITSPSTSLLRPSGNLFVSQALIEDRMTQLHSSAREIAGIDEDKVVILGYFHNPYVVYEIVSTAQSYEAVKIGRENYRIKTRNKEYLIFYVPSDKPEDNIEYILSQYDLKDYAFLSATYDLKFLSMRGFKTRDVTMIKVAL